MPGNPSAWGCKIWVDYLTGVQLDHTAPRTTYLALLTANFADDADLAVLPELTTPGYARQAVSWTTATNARPSSASNAAVVTFGPFTNDVTSPITHAALVTAQTGTSGQVLFKFQLDSPQQPAAGQALQIAIGKLSITIQ